MNNKYERKVTKIGNSYGITFPKEFLQEAGISYGDNVQMELKDGEIVIQKKKDVKLPKGLSPDFFEVLERNTKKHEKTIKDLVDR
ncbi:AbrB/MazE/SpoVT family DNA-binding domain-containing protein [Radiobacillus sp. PE A8.2]|uniref:AbrB/MazE/SpoVT family DNA-binding domain-containing protein n=1 Tax=Radiobacillus sp. PE A8.2 TaxID=3380349 RepID=UPI003890D835